MPPFLDSASIVAANRIFITEAACIVPNQILLSSHGPLSAGAGHYCDASPVQSVIRTRACPPDVCLVSTIFGTCTSIARQNRRQTIWAST